MFPYRVKYTESEYYIQNNNLLYKIHQQCQNTFNILETMLKTFEKKCFIISIDSISHILYCCSVRNFVIFVFNSIYVYIYICIYTEESYAFISMRVVCIHCSFINRRYTRQFYGQTRRFDDPVQRPAGASRREQVRSAVAASFEEFV